MKKKISTALSLSSEILSPQFLLSLKEISNLFLPESKRSTNQTERSEFWFYDKTQEIPASQLKSLHVCVHRSLSFTLYYLSNHSEQKVETVGLSQWPKNQRKEEESSRDKKYGRRTSSWRKQEKGFISDRGKNLFFLLTEKRDLYQEGLHCLFPSDSTVAPGICILDDKERGDSNSRSSSCCWCRRQKKNIMQETLREDKEQVYWCHCIRNKLPLELPSRQVTQRRWVGTSG